MCLILQNRTSGDSGFDSQQPTPSPSPTEPSRYASSCDSPSPTHTTYLTPNPSITSSPAHSTPSHTIYLTPTLSTTTIMHVTPHTLPPSPAHTVKAAPPRSKSSDTLRTLTIIPSTTSSHNRSTSAELVRDQKQKPASPSTPKKVSKKNSTGFKRESKKKGTSGGLFGFGRSKTPSSPAKRRGSSPGSGRGNEKRRGSLTPPSNRQDNLDLPDMKTRVRSSSSVDLTKVN